MEPTKLARSLGSAFVAQGTSLLISIATSLLVPKILGLDQFGYWQLFVFYSTYVGIAHLGLNDGMYLLLGGQHRGEVDGPALVSQLRVGITFQLAISLVVAAASLLVDMGPDRQLVLLLVAIYLVVSNATSFIGFAFQAMEETYLFSRSILIERLAFAAALAVLLPLRVEQFGWYAAAYTASKAVSLTFCLWHAREFLRLRSVPTSDAIRLTLGSIRVGSSLLAANFAGMLILGFARFAIDYRWGIRTFGELSLALALVNFFMLFVTQAGMVLFPSLRRATAEELRRVLRMLRDHLSLILPSVYILYFPTAYLLTLWLPEYARSFDLLALLLPICIFDGRMNLLGTTYYKVLRWERRLLLLNLVTLAFAAAGAALGVVILDSVWFVIASAVAGIVARSWIAEHSISRRLGLPPNRLSTWSLLLTPLFVLLSSLLAPQIALLVYASAYLVFLLCFRNTARLALSQIRRVATHRETSPRTP